MLYYLNPLLEDGIFYSCDSLQYSFESPDVDTAESFLSFLSHLPDCMHYRSLKDFDYQYLFVFGIKELSFSIGPCMGGVKREAILQDFLGFNPNEILGEVACDNGFMRMSVSPFDQKEVEYRDLQSQIGRLLRTILNELFPMVETVKVRRWDLAVDVPYGRDCVQLIKDNRRYGQFCKSAQGFIEHLGCMSAPGRVKVYSEQIEAGLDYPLARIEVTLSSLSYIGYCRCWPNVYTRKVIDLAKSKVMVQPLIEQPVDRVDYYLRQMSAPTKRRYKALLLDCPFEIEGPMFNELRSQLLRYQEESFYE